MIARRFAHLLIAGALCAAPTAAFDYWSAAQLKSYDQSMASRESVVTKQLGTYLRHSAVMVHRQASGEAELHEHDADVMIFQVGSGTLLIGGKIPKQRVSAPGEIRGSSIEGGTKQAVAPGDIVHIPARVPHQVLLAPGATITYFTLKVKGQ